MGMEKVLIALCAALAIGLTAIATAWAQSRIGLQERGHWPRSRSFPGQSSSSSRSLRQW